MAMPDITFNQYKTAGGLVGSSENYTYTENEVEKKKTPTIKNAFANAKFTIGNNSTYGAGGLVGYSYNLEMQNSYAHVYDETGLSTSNFALLISFSEAAQVEKTYGFESDFAFYRTGSSVEMNDCYKYSLVMDADKYGYMYYDNVVTVGEEQVALFKKLNEWVDDNNSNDYAGWSRPTSSEINSDMPVLLIGNNASGTGDFRSLATYDNGTALQYGGTLRDGDQLGTMLGRSESVYVFGDVTEDLSSVDIKATKVTFSEKAAITNPGALGNYEYNYVGITFDNPCRKAVDFYGNTLGRDWHMFSSPLQDAPLGMDYTDNSQVPFGQYVVYPFTNASTSDGRDGYFPSQVPSSYTKPEGEAYDYPYDYYCWYEPQWQWINFKRNGNSHWHFDLTGHDYIEYHYDNNTTNSESATNEDNLVPGKGYMMAIEDDTYMQSHGKLNNGDVEIMITNQADANYTTFGGKGQNLIGNPYQAYLDFDKFGDDIKEYYVYDALKNNGEGEPYGGYLFYTQGGSKGGAYAARYLHPHQGFFVETTAAEQGKQTITFSPSMCVARDGITSEFRNTQPAYPLVNLFVDDEQGRTDILVVEFNRPENGGGKKDKALRDGNHLLYVHNGDTDYAAFFAKEGTERVPVRFLTFESEPTPYTLRWNTQNGYFHSLYLIDNITGVRYDMTLNDSYSFTASKNDYASRFYIVFDVTDVEENEEEPVSNSFAFFNGNNWVVNGKGHLELIDVTGRVLYAKDVYDEQNSVNLSRYAQGVYLLRLSDGKSIRLQKIILR